MPVREKIMESGKNTKTIEEIVSYQQENNRLIGNFAAEPWIELSLTIAQLKSLFFIADRGKTNFKKLADALGVTPPNVTGIVDRLVEHGLVSRTENPEDRRIMLLQITAKGRNLLHNLQQNRASHMATILGKLSDDDLSALVRGMKALSEAARAFNKEYPFPEKWSSK
jgi:MarR family transcriptional regulator, organic hydroperoxide resistance regulator